MYKVESRGIDGHYTSTLYHEGVAVDEETGFKSVKDCERWAHTRAEIHAEINRPSEIVLHQKTFSV
jgi:hypothetical protein